MTHIIGKENQQPAGPIEVPKRITVRLLERYFNAMPCLLNCLEKIEKEGEGMSKKYAQDALIRWKKELEKPENQTLDPSEAVFGFAALLSSLEESMTVGCDHHAARLAQITEQFCTANELGAPAPGYASRLVQPFINVRNNRVK